MIIINTLLVSSQLLIAVADVMPKIDIQKTCRSAANVTGTLTHQDIDACIADEQGARDELAQSWRHFSAASKAQCIHLSTDYLPSYIEALTCLSMARDAKKMSRDDALSSSQRRR